MLLLIGLAAFPQSDTSGIAISYEGYDHIPDQQAKAAVYQIVRYTGLTPNFTILAENVPNAVAFIKNKKRYIAYNPDFIVQVMDQTQTNWSAISILAHEVGHHLLGHTLKNKGSNPGDELAADRFSGFILSQMGASLAEAQAAAKTLDSVKTGKGHPPRQARLDAIANGWNDAQKLAIAPLQPQPDTLLRDSTNQINILYECSFVGDPNRYFVDETNQIIWFDNYGSPVVIGTVSISESYRFEWTYHFAGQDYGVDSAGNIWLESFDGATMEVGKAKSFNIGSTKR